VLDYTGFQTERTVGPKPLKVPPLRFFEPATFDPRVDRYAHMAEFKSPTELSKYPTAGYDLVSIQIARMNRGRWSSMARRLLC
jgi:hypothetical protein